MPRNDEYLTWSTDFYSSGQLYTYYYHNYPRAYDYMSWYGDNFVKPPNKPPTCLELVRNKLACGLAKYAKYTISGGEHEHIIELLLDGRFQYYVNGSFHGTYKINELNNDNWVLTNTRMNECANES